MASPLTLGLVLLLGGCISSTRQQQSSSRVELGTAYLIEGNAPGAVETLRQATELDPRNWNAWNKLGLATMSLGAFDEAEDAFKRAVDLVPEEAEVHNNYGTLLLRQGRYEDAIGQFEIALEDLTYRKPAMVMSNLGSAYIALEEHETAILWLDQAVTRAPNLCQARFTRGLALRATDKGPKALDDFETVIQLCGKDALGAYYNAGQILLEMDDRQTGCHYIRKVAADATESTLGREAADFAAREC
jgi:tetratricopeptide (TPR) repeat protein